MLIGKSKKGLMALRTMRTTKNSVWMESQKTNLSVAIMIQCVVCPLATNRAPGGEYRAKFASGEDPTAPIRRKLQ
jgi:hypothetical protein